MPWPQPTDYHEAIQHPNFCFRDPELSRCEPALNAFGLPMPCSGNFAIVYRLNCPVTQRSWAVKCFIYEVSGLQQRYHAISEHLRRARLPFMVTFDYLQEGIRIHGSWFPVLKMPWVEGVTLNEFVRQHVEKQRSLAALCRLWVRLSRKLRRAEVAHADIQHGNVLLVPTSDPGRVALRVIDYDGMYIPALASVGSGEVGHPSYQHPERIRSGTYGPEVDRFSHLAIYVALRSLIICGKDLWDRYDNGDNLLFRREDYAAPAASLLFNKLWNAPTPVCNLAGHLILASQGCLANVPLLDELLARSRGQSLSPEELGRAAGLMAGEPEKEVPPWAGADLRPQTSGGATVAQGGSAWLINCEGCGRDFPGPGFTCPHCGFVDWDILLRTRG